MRKTKSRVLFPVAMVILAVAAAGIYFASIQYGGIISPADIQSESIKKFSSYDEMRDFLRENVGSSYGGLLKTSVGEAVALPTSSESRDSSSGSVDYSGTNVQVEGVDEPDIVKTDGKYIYYSRYNRVFIVDAVPASESEVISEIEFSDDVTLNEMFVEGDKLVVFATKYFYHILPAERGVATSLIWPGPYQDPETFVYVYDVSDRTSPTLERNVIVDGTYVDSRMIDGRIYVVINSRVGDVDNVSTPVIIDGEKRIATQPSDVYYFPQPDYSYGFTTILSLDATDSGDEVSSRTILMGASQNIYVSGENIYVAYQNEPNYYDYVYDIVDDVFIPNVPQEIADDMRSIENTRLSKGAKFEAISSLFYDHIRTLSDDERSRIQVELDEKYQEIYEEMNEERQKSIVHRISIEDGAIEYEATGIVRGAILNQFSMDEHEGYFRVATTTNNFNAVPIGVVRDVVVTPVGAGSSGSGETVATSNDDCESGSAVHCIEEAKAVEAQMEPQISPDEATTLNHVYVLDMNLNVVGSLENIAPNERIFSTRFIGDRAYLVTFEQVDPFFVIDMSNPTQPQILGSLKIPGFSQYLHPYDEDHIIGVGMDTATDGGFVRTSGVKISLFDVSDVSNPREISSYRVGGSYSYSEALYEHKAFLFSREKDLIVMPMTVNDENYRQTFQGAYAFSISLEDGIGLKGTVSHDVGDYGSYVRRSLYIGDVLWTVSDATIKANNLSDFSEINEIELPSPFPDNVVKTDPLA